MKVCMAARRRLFFVQFSGRRVEAIAVLCRLVVISKILSPGATMRMGIIIRVTYARQAR